MVSLPHLWPRHHAQQFVVPLQLLQVHRTRLDQAEYSFSLYEPDCLSTIPPSPGDAVQEVISSKFPSVSAITAS